MFVTGIFRSMRLFYYLSIGIFMLSISGCMSFEERVVDLTFWTDRVEEEGASLKLFANDRYLGELVAGNDHPSCIDSTLIHYEVRDAEDVHLSIENKEGMVFDIGLVNLYSVSTGIKIKPSKQGTLFVEQELDGACTLVYVNYSE